MYVNFPKNIKFPVTILSILVRIIVCSEVFLFLNEGAVSIPHPEKSFI